MSKADKKDLLDRLRAAAADAPNGDLLREAADLVEKSYFDGFDAACDVAASVRIEVSCEINPAIQLGIMTVSRILSEQGRSIRNVTIKEPST